MVKVTSLVVIAFEESCLAPTTAVEMGNVTPKMEPADAPFFKVLVVPLTELTVVSHLLLLQFLPQLLLQFLLQFLLHPFLPQFLPQFLLQLPFQSQLHLLQLAPKL